MIAGMSDGATMTIRSPLYGGGSLRTSSGCAAGERLNPASGPGPPTVKNPTGAGRIAPGHRPPPLPPPSVDAGQQRAPHLGIVERRQEVVEAQDSGRRTDRPLRLDARRLAEHRHDRAMAAPAVDLAAPQRRRGRRRIRLRGPFHAVEGHMSARPHIRRLAARAYLSHRA